MTVYLLNKTLSFPPVSEADPDGLLAIGGDLSAERLLLAYSSGIFPWFEQEGIPFWYSPEPRLVLFPERLKISASLGRVIRSGKFEVRIDTAFEEVIRACAAVSRKHGEETWISEGFISAYVEMHRQGYAHSAESYHQGKLVGGLYGISLGKAFFGESMFHNVTDASKTAFAALVGSLKIKGFHFIDCQVVTEHLVSMGAVPVPREEYLDLLEGALKE